MKERDVGLHRGGCFRRELILVEGAKDGLGSEHQDIGIPGDGARRPQEVVELESVHAASCSCSQWCLKERSTWTRVVSSKTPAKGVF